MKKSRKINIAIILGTRPEAIKLAPVIKEMERYPDLIELNIISTGQHREMLGQIFKVFEITPHFDLDIMKYDQSLSYIGSQCLAMLPELLSRRSIDLLLVQGDTTTAFIGALAGFYSKIRIAHVEAGLRTSNKYNPFPEEMNRRLISPLSDFNFAPTPTNKKNLLQEAISETSIYVTGNTVIDALLIAAHKQYEFEDANLRNFLQNGRKKILITAHRRENFGEPLVNICRAVLELQARYDNIEFIYPVHLNPNVHDVVYKILGNEERIYLINPMEYLSFVHLMKKADLILTDSGGVQEEAPSLGKPVLVLRTTTERPEAVDAGTVRLIGTKQKDIVAETSRLLEDRNVYQKMSKAINPYGDGKAADRITRFILYEFGLYQPRPEEFNAGMAR